MDSSLVIWGTVAVGVCFVVYLFHTRQLKWLLGVLRNAALGIAGMLLGNMLLAPLGIAVGVNLLTVFVVGLLGIPGLLLLFVTGWMV